MVPHLRPLVGRFNASLVRTPIAPPTKADGFYQSAQYKAWRDVVKTRARYQCEAIEYGRRCEARTPRARLYADHVHEIQDGGDPLDPANGQCLCHRHHQLKSALEAKDRKRD